MLTKFALAALLASTLLACAPSGPIDVGFEGTDEELAAAQAAGAEWNDACGRELVLVHRGEGHISLHGQHGRVEGTHAAVTHSHDGDAYEIVFQDDDVNHAPYMPMIAHEMGHALGLPHTVDGLMSKSIPNGVVGADGRLTQGMITQAECDAIQR
jgi:hypothetical protein